MRVLEDSLYRCNKCGFCQATCPFYQTTREEWTVARGRLRLMKGVLEGTLAPSEGYSKVLFQCFSCGACAASCPSGVQVEKILIHGRRDLARQGFLPDSLAQLGRTVAATGNLTGEANDMRLSWAENLEFSPPQGGRPDVVYFVGCVSSLYPQAFGLPQNMVRLLDYVAAQDSKGPGYAVLGGQEVCCGYPLYISGQEDEARAMAEANVRAVRETGARTLLTTCPSCYRAWREFYPELLGEDLDVEVVHASQWLANADLPSRPIAPLRVDSTPGDKRLRVTYHDPCDLGRGSGIYDEPRAFLAGIDGVELAEMAYARADAFCCGGGGNMESLNREASQAVVRLRLDQARSTGADLIVTACPQCKRTLGSGTSAGKRIPIVDIVELAWRSVPKG